MSRHSGLLSRPNDRPLRRRLRIGLTPLIDVVFILLIFLMLASRFADWRTVTLNAPRQASAGGAVQGAVLVRLRSDGTVEVNARPIAVARLSAVIAAHLRRDPDRRFVVHPQNGVTLQEMVSVLDRMMVSGASNISFLRDRRGGA